MVTDLFLLCVATATLIALADWRTGVRLAIVVGCLQDPIRKLAPGGPPLFAIASLPVWLALAFGALSRDPRLWARFTQAYPSLGRILRWFLACLVLPVVLIFSHGLGAWRLALLGAFAYLAPVGALVLGFSFVHGPSELRRFLAFYCLFTAPMLIGGALEYADLFPAWPVLGTEALGAVWRRYTAGGHALRLISGFYRSPDIMGWHAAMLVMTSLTLALTARHAARAPWLVAAAWGALCLVMAGRRKAIMMPVLWLGFALVVYVRGRRAREVVSTVSLAALVGTGLYFASGEIAVHGDYYAYAASGAVDAPQRLTQGVMGALHQTLLQSGFLGRGIGSATQGGQHLGPGLEQSWQESGPSKLMVELGVPGFVCALLLAVALGRAGWAALRRIPATPLGGLQVGLSGMMIANAASFIVSHQIFGDLLIVCLTSLWLGITLSSPRWARAREPASGATPPLPPQRLRIPAERPA